MRTNPQFSVHLTTFFKEFLNGKLQFLWNDIIWRFTSCAYLSDHFNFIWLNKIKWSATFKLYILALQPVSHQILSQPKIEYLKIDLFFSMSVREVCSLYDLVCIFNVRTTIINCLGTKGYTDISPETKVLSNSI